MCHCCGAYYHYIEHGPICTQFCLNEDSELDVPDKITLEDGTELPVKCDSLVGKNYGCHDGGNRGYRQTTTAKPSPVRDFIPTTKINTKRTTLRSTTISKSQSIIQTTRATPKQRPTTRRKTTTSAASQSKRVPLSFGHEL